MKWLFVPAAAALSLAVASPALAAPATTDSGAGARATIQLAQRDRDRDTRRDRRQDRRDMRQDRRRDRRDVRPQQRRDRRDMRRDRREDRRDFRRFDWGHYRPGHPPPNWDRHRNFNPRAWQRNYRAERRYRWHRYHRPPGWYYRRWAYGMVFPSFFWTRDYWITSYWQFGLMDPPYGYVWVRYGPDAVLVNVSNGYILRVVYGLYY